MPLKDQIITRKFVKSFAFPRFIARLELLKRGDNLVSGFSPIRHHRVGENPGNEVWGEGRGAVWGIQKEAPNS